MYTPHTITLILAEEGNDYAMQYHLTVLHGVMLQAGKQTNVLASGLADADAVTLFIPFCVAATDAAGNPKTYVSPKAFENAEDKSGIWTVTSRGESSGADCYFIKGEVLEGISYSDAMKTYDDVYRVSSVDTFDYGSEKMQHWEVGGR